MMAVNLGTRGADEARNLVEYCNCETDTLLYHFHNVSAEAHIVSRFMGRLVYASVHRSTKQDKSAF